LHVVRIRVFIRGVALCAATPLLASCSEGVLSPHGPIGASELTILYDATAIMLAVVIPVILMTIGFAWWFRAGNARAHHFPSWEYSGRIEMIVWSIPALVVVFLGGIAWIGSHDLDPPQPIESTTVPLDVDVVSLDWKWLFIYPGEGVASVNRLVVPVGTPVRFRLTSASVMNSFFVPQLGSQIYTMPGMTTRLNLQADQPGKYPGFSRHGRLRRPGTAEQGCGTGDLRRRPTAFVRGHLRRASGGPSRATSGALRCWAGLPRLQSPSTNRS
jgi:cytochrome o ubiquinol oxidase subunit 2